MSSSWVDAFDTDAERLRYDVPEEPSASYQRVEDNGVVIRPIGEYHYTVAITDCPAEERHDHVVEYFVDDWEGELARFGRCSCKGWQFHDDECAHLWGIRMAERHGTVSVHHVDDGLDATPTCPFCGASNPPESMP